MNADKRIRYLEEQLKRLRETVRNQRLELESRDVRIRDLREAMRRPFNSELDYLMPRQPSLGELMFGRDA